MSSSQRDGCDVCLLIGTYLPWALIIGGGVVATLPLPEAWDKGSAYLIAFALLVLAGSYILRRIHHSNPDRPTGT